MNLTDLTKEKAKYLVDLSKEVKGNLSPGKSGGILNLIYPYFQSRETSLIGEVPNEKLQKYGSLSLEKSLRIYAHWLRFNSQDFNTDNLVSSYQIRDPITNKWGGAVLFPNEKMRNPNVISFSGLSEHADEALSLILGYSLGWAKEGDLFAKVREASQNPIVDEMFHEFLKKYPINLVGKF